MITSKVPGSEGVGLFTELTNEGQANDKHGDRTDYLLQMGDKSMGANVLLNR